MNPDNDKKKVNLRLYDPERDSLDYLMEYLRIAEEKGDKKMQARYLHQIGHEYSQRKNYEKALEFFEKELLILEQLDDLKLKAPTVEYIAAVLYAQGKVDEALRMYEEALSIYEQLGMADSPQVQKMKKYFEPVKEQVNFASNVVEDLKKKFPKGHFELKIEPSDKNSENND